MLQSELIKRMTKVLQAFQRVRLEPGTRDHTVEDLRQLRSEIDKLILALQAPEKVQ